MTGHVDTSTPDGIRRTVKDMIAKLKYESVLLGDNEDYHLADRKVSQIEILIELLGVIHG